MIVNMKAALPKFDRKEIFSEVDASNKRFDTYTKEERLEFREIAKKIRESGMNNTETL